MTTTVDLGDELDALMRAVAWAPPRESWTFGAGDRVGPYVVRAPIGRGGMGEVYRAHDPRLDREVALKVLSRSALHHDALERFAQEAHLLAVLQHPGVLSVFDYGWVGDLPYLVLDYLEGETLRQVLERGPLELDDARSWIGAVGEAMAAVHTKGIVHRDLKPENLFRTREGLIKVLDFGLAKLVDSQRGLTATGQIVGTVEYMAPEQIAGGGVGPAADQFALAAVLVEMLSGQRLFRRESIMETLYAITSEPIDVRGALGATVPPHWPAVLERALEREPARRHASMAALLHALASGDDHPRAPARGPEPRTRYARNGSVHLAYRVFGQGPVDLVFVPGFVSQVEEWWSEAEGATFMAALGEFARVVVFDKRGSGLSDRGAPDALDEATRLEDIRVVMDAVGMERAVMLGISEGGPTAATFAVRYSARTRGLALYGTAARCRHDRKIVALRSAVAQSWGEGGTTAMLAPSALGVPRLEAWLARWERLSASPGAALAIIDLLEHVDVRPLLSQVSAPALILHRRHDRLVSLAGGREMAELIPDARLVELEGSDHLPMLGDTRALLEALRDFVANS